MNAHIALKIGRELIWLLLPAALVFLSWGRADSWRRAATRAGGSIVFAPNRRAFWALPATTAYLFVCAGQYFATSYGKAFPLCVASMLAILAVMMNVSFPGTIIITAEGLKQISWFWKNKRIDWSQITEISVEKRTQAITITAMDGVKIVHDRQLPDRERLLVELRSGCDEELPPNFPDRPARVS